MSGIFHSGQWMENSGMACPKCGGTVYGQLEWVCMPGAPEWERITNYYCPTCKGCPDDPSEPIYPEQTVHFIIGYQTERHK